jgi:hypothetical protein
MAAEEINKPPSLPPYPEVLNLNNYFPFLCKKKEKRRRRKSYCLLLL